MVIHGHLAKPLFSDFSPSDHAFIPEPSPPSRGHSWSFREPPTPCLTTWYMDAPYIGYKVINIFEGSLNFGSDINQFFKNETNVLTFINYF